ncbi:class I SAM-dependent methyltransferase [Bordetella holmesii]|uniref:Cyclopropane-fatty-acyl-phospholipid synthase n=1 Tax=Bordetella holmesii CDC-H585-BH TaxID=1331206 RepID=A0A158M814_9BORD|nr:class I SAM-dependent methyltransferase [Bordetella holmesii]KAK86649.1 cyclopropane-fatty-acyl-phospholipid synthase [Bordetella holmesii CDC-H572-BH]KAK96495.1 cyclopropane-fatty-acyl-phospholipid synthase [Bordetella holmesii CDC-H635-BH]KAK98462.1 cyclopropane-fatty-acyl-phospholipid synthase [Bordetella holmesii CDC-H585-BH]KCV06687.1 cyclopropane-fatty-acyl-phospholipid synthase [Bordetella holmesii CDC-H629-BH]KCV08020.1 cyclopropane-fatty-acyl-phospholipid synthase [Bordetella holme
MVNPLLSVVERKLAALPVSVQLQLPDGTVLGPPQAKVRFAARDKGALAHLAEGSVGVLGQDYVEGRIDIQGSMRDVMAAAAALLPGSPVDAARGGWLTELIRKVTSVWRHSVERDAKQIEFHYDLSDEFYALWLDPRRVYSCAYYREPGMTLAQAQEAKLDLICRKLKLRQGERFLDVGAGWGGLLLWAAENYGVDATGITLSRNQHAHVNRLIESKGLSGRVRMELLDYRKLDETQPYDKIASVGMFEHVGRAQLPGYFAKLRNLIKPGGLIMNHGITAAGLYNSELGSGMGEFIEKYIFPGGELTHISSVLEAVTAGGLEAGDVENLRPHYARTLWAWSDELETKLEDASRILSGEQGARSLRAYRLYLAGCAMAFEHGWIALHQILVSTPAKGDDQELNYPPDRQYPWRREYMYQDIKA